MSVSVTLQSVCCLFPAGPNPQATVLADSGVQSWIALNASQDVEVQLISYANFTGAEIDSFELRLTFYVTAVNAATIALGVPAFTTRMATAAPQITKIFTFGIVALFG